MKVGFCCCARWKHRLGYRLFSSLLIAAFFANGVIPSQFVSAQTLPIGRQTIGGLTLPNPGTLLSPSAPFVPVLIKGIKIYPDNPLQFDFIVDNGHTKFDAEEVKKESDRLIKYFFAALTVPQNDFWVNLSPYEGERIIPEELSRTELGRDLLAQDYILKQLTASFLSPDSQVGARFWKKVRQMAQEKFGTTEIPINTFNKVWIMPESATIFENGQTAFIVKSRLKVMLAEDYVALRASDSGLVTPASKNLSEPRGTSHQSQQVEKDVNVLSSEIKELVIPAIEQEVNEGKHFAPLRQIYHSLLLAKWYKETVKSFVGARHAVPLRDFYIDQNKVSGIEMEEKGVTSKIYNLYVDAYKKGAYSFIKEDYDALSQEMIPRKYFTGGFSDANTAMTAVKTEQLARLKLIDGQAFQIPVNSAVNGQVLDLPVAPASPAAGDLAMLTEGALEDGQWKSLEKAQKHDSYKVTLGNKTIFVHAIDLQRFNFEDLFSKVMLPTFQYVKKKREGIIIMAPDEIREEDLSEHLKAILMDQLEQNDFPDPGRPNAQEVRERLWQVLSQRATFVSFPSVRIRMRELHQQGQLSLDDIIVISVVPVLDRMGRFTQDESVAESIVSGSIWPEIIEGVKRDMTFFTQSDFNFTNFQIKNRIKSILRTRPPETLVNMWNFIHHDALSKVEKEQVQIISGVLQNPANRKKVVRIILQKSNLRSLIRQGEISEETIAYNQRLDPKVENVRKVYDKLFDNPSDAAMTAAASPEQSRDPLGGIDMNEMEYDRQGTGVDIQFSDKAMRSLLPNGINTLTPVIINVIPVPSVLPLLGLKERPPKELTISKADQ